MISIKTTNACIIDVDGTLATGTLIITPSDSFQFLDDDSKVKKVTVNPVQVSFVQGKLSFALEIAPTIGASQDRTDLYYTAQFITDKGTWTDRWVIDADGGDLEITDITKVIVTPQIAFAPYVKSDDVVTTPTAYKVPRANALGVLDSGWVATTIGTPIISYFQESQPADPTAGQIAIWNNGSQILIWVGTQWVAFA